MGGHARHEDLEAADAFAPGDDLATITGRFGHQHIFRLAALGLDQRPRSRAADLFIGGEELGDAERRTLAAHADLAERMVGQIGAALHVVDAGSEGAVTLDPERQALDEADRVHRIEMAQDQEARRVLSP